MTAPAHAGRTLFVNMPVADVERSKAFFAKLGFTYNPMLTDETAACMLVGAQRQRELEHALQTGGHSPLRFRTVALFTFGGVAVAVMTVVLVIAQT